MCYFVIGGDAVYAETCWEQEQSVSSDVEACCKRPLKPDSGRFKLARITPLPHGWGLRGLVIQGTLTPTVSEPHSVQKVPKSKQMRNAEVDEPES